MVALTLACFAVTSLTGVNPAWAALGGAVLLAAPRVARRQSGLASLVRAASVPFLLFVLGLGLVVGAVVSNGLGGAITRLLPGGSSLPSLLAIAAIAAVLANVVNNLPAVLAPPPAVALASRPPRPGPGHVDRGEHRPEPHLCGLAGHAAAVLVAVCMEWRDVDVDLAEFTRLGLVTGAGRRWRRPR